jgi:hypothetical protein
MHSGSLKKSQLTLSQGMMKKGDVIVIAADDNDDETRRGPLPFQNEVEIETHIIHAYTIIHRPTLLHVKRHQPSEHLKR